jgi:pimeloyl-ACP methyl ester carboxylesterase
VRQFDKEGPRAEGPAVVWAGRDEGPALVVVDPAGAARHNELPASWDTLAEHFQIAWCRIPASKQSLEDVEDVLETLSERQSSANIVASGQSCTSAIAIAMQFSDIVNAVLLVDPTDADDMTKLAEAGIDVRVIARSHGGDDDRVEAPMPLGHPEVVASLATTLASLE